MTFTDDLRGLFEQALDDATTQVARAASADLGRPTPCTDWDLGALVGHMVGQNEGFAAAVSAGDAPLSAYAAPALRQDEVRPRWDESADRLRAAFQDAPPDRRLRLAEFDREVSVSVALGMQVVDNAVHAWDVATALGEHYRPAEAVAQVVLESARQIAGRPGGTPGVFAPPQEVSGTDPWLEALALLGR
ncbi:TIGR03086 family metal-binding protein [Nocardioides sp. CER19]|uniref:TIGR03086 family metal-binding protein n=1 Tax=Nocardioides sp. CER19 TaxID=3038538 RepID=UPI002446827E|nr:TIGR03086 family metal-binding protein [Nocardioides sp. CER19]MDH2415887.1 TIGR03086 family metal-binding protein [Nocardioides sp. CER19]